MSESIFRIHPAIGLARVGNSEEYYLGPETIAGLDVPDNGEIKGGLPIKPGTEDTPIQSSDLRDAEGAMKRQAARFKIYQYPKEGADQYPAPEGEEIQIGSRVNGKKVVDILWTVHVANKKANCYQLDESDGLEAYDNENHPPVRNLGFGKNLDAENRLKQLMIDPGPRAISKKVYDAYLKEQSEERSECSTPLTNPFEFAQSSTATIWEKGAIQKIADYPQSFPDDHFSPTYTPSDYNCPNQRSIQTLGSLEIDKQGRLIVLGGFGKATGWYRADGSPSPLDDDVNNNGWFDDASDGPVNATLVLEGEDNETEEVMVTGSAWVVTADPSYAPQTLNVVSLWDDVFNTFVQSINLLPDLYQSHSFHQNGNRYNNYNQDYLPGFSDQVQPIFISASLQRWNTNLPEFAIKIHDKIGEIKAHEDADTTYMSGLTFIRNPFDPEQSYVGALMPLSLGDAGKSFLSVTETQYFFLTQWDAHSTQLPEKKITLGPGEFLDKAVLANCLGGRFNPGIEITFICRVPELYIEDWRTQGTGPFRIDQKPLNYWTARKDKPFLTSGWFPFSDKGVEPGDMSKFMAIPWHTDYNSCATHTTYPATINQGNPNTLYWSWPAQRPVSVNVAQDVTFGNHGKPKLGDQRYSVRGQGTYSNFPQKVGRYQDRLDFLKNWQRVGFVIQGTQIDNGIEYPPHWYLEVESRLPEEKAAVFPTVEKERSIEVSVPNEFKAKVNPDS